LFGKRAGAVILDHLQKAMTAVLRANFQTVFPKKKQVIPLDIFVENMVSTFWGLLTWWLDNDSPCPQNQ